VHDEQGDGHGSLGAGGISKFRSTARWGGLLLDARTLGGLDDVFTYVRMYVTLDTMKRTATDLRAHLYEVLDHVAKTGEPVEIVRGGVELCIVRKQKAPRRRGAHRTLRELIVGDPASLVHVEWPWGIEPAPK
jgi:antitoxin (DNA-binding transcriptional repressor) of toxin-antitoxin stability system